MGKSIVRMAPRQEYATEKTRVHGTGLVILPQVSFGKTWFCSWDHLSNKINQDFVHGFINHGCISEVLTVCQVLSKWEVEVGTDLHLFCQSSTSGLQPPAMSGVWQPGATRRSLLVSPAISRCSPGNGCNLSADAEMGAHVG